LPRLPTQINVCFDIRFIFKASGCRFISAARRLNWPEENKAEIITITKHFTPLPDIANFHPGQGQDGGWV